MKKINYKKIALITLLMIISSMVFAESEYFDDGLNMIIDEVDVTNNVDLALKDDRVLVPLRFVSEYLGAEVEWQPELRRVDILKDNRMIYLWIDSHLISYGDGTYDISDVAPVIIDDHTYVPVRLVANALGVNVSWEASTRSVIIDSSELVEKTKFYDVSIISHGQNASITGETIVNLETSKDILEKASSVKLMKINKETGKGYVISESKTDLESLSYLPRLSDNGEHIWVVAYYDNNRKWLGGTTIPVKVAVTPKTSIDVANRGATEALTLRSTFNFMPYKVSYKLTNLETDESSTVSVADPFNDYKWYIGSMKTGSYKVTTIVYDEDLTPYESEGVMVDIRVEEYLSLSGVKPNQVLDGGTYLVASRNFDVKETIYTIEDVKTGEARVLATIPWGGYTWYPTLDDIGEKYLRVKVIDVNDKLHVSPGVKVTVDLSPKISLVGVGPNQILTDDVELSIRANVETTDVIYYVEHIKTGAKIVLDAEDSLFKPTNDFEGEIRVYAVATYNGEKLSTEKIELKVYLSTLYGPQAIIAKEKFLPFVTELALVSFEDTGMSAALQTAQGILETGWGQSVPVDKYTNQLSYNLFGIKGSGSNGSVVSNTWEVYNGVSFRTDANFRAYNNVQESWDDHKRILLELSRYQIFRDVMYDSTLGAWAVRRAGYATDPNYPIKLMNIIKQYDLHLLDEVGVY